MKKLFTLFAIGLIATLTSNLSAQSQRMAFVEEATQASCGPCASANPGLQALMNANADNVIFLAYHVWWPGFDQMYLDNPDEINVRVGEYYGYGFAPQVALQGDFAGNEGGVSELTQSLIDGVNAEESEFDMTLSASVVNGVLQITGSIDATMAAEGDFKLRIMIAEDVIHSSDAPGGTNGETAYHHVFKGFVGGPEGINLENSWEVGDSYIIDETFNIGELTIYHTDGLEVMAIIQNDDDKYIHQGVKDNDIEIVYDYNNSCAAVSISDLPNSVCTDEQTLSPVFKLINVGINDLTSATITYNINDGVDQVMDWAGSLTSLQSESIVLDPYEFVAIDTNVLSVNVSMPNGVEDEDLTPNNTQTATIVAAPLAQLNLTLVINTDCWPEENTWNIRNSENAIVASGGPYNGQVETEITESIALPGDDCYSFTFMDAYGDGLHGSQYDACGTDGSLYVFDELGNVVFSYDGSYDIASETRAFEGSSLLSVDEIANVSNFNIYPNPTSNVAHISMNLLESNTVRLEVVDLLGKVVYAEDIGQVAAGNQLFDVDAASIGSGLYMFNICLGEQKVTKRVSISK